MVGIHTFSTPKAKAKIDRIVTELEKMPMTRDELQCLLAVAKPTMRRYLTHLRDEPKRIYVKRWRSSGSGRFSPIYAAGNLPDAPEPIGMSRRERNVLQWQRIKADRDRHDRMKAAARVNGAIKRVRAAPQPWFAALPGARDIAARKEAA
jgi:hypothetical protein